MSSKVIHITSTDHFRQTLTSSTFVVVDFYADWCGPCRTIAPVYEQLANTETKPGRMVFVKVNVDNQRAIAGQYSVSAMPTFLILRSGSVQNTIQGADPSALRSAVMSASALASKGPARQSAAFTSAGRVLGAEGSTGPQTNNSGAFKLPNLSLSSILPSGPAARSSGLVPTLVRFLVLYLTTLFSLETWKAAQESPYAVKNSSRTN